MCKTTILSAGRRTTITQCPCCDVIYIWHNNLLLSFSMADFITFKNVIEKTSFTENCLPFPDKRNRIILRTPNDDISFAFTHRELETFKARLNEALFMKEVYSLVGPSANGS